VGSKTISEETKPENKENKTGNQPAEKKELRLAVFGDSDFITNRYYNLSGNGNLFLNTVNWLTEESDLISIQPKTRAPRTINLTPSQGRFLMLLSIILLPLIILVIGLTIWIRRRSL